MPTAVGPNTKGEENLVFGYDLGDTRNSYKGEPTTNLVTNGDFSNGTSGWGLQGSAANYSEVTTFQGRTVLRSKGLTNYNTSGYLNQVISVTTGQTYTVSFDYYIESGQLTYDPDTANNSNAFFTSPVGEWRTHTSTWTAASSTLVINLWGSDSAPGYWYITNIQCEQKSHATPFVNGTRSATQGLIDLKGNSTIDLSNVSFDSNAQMTFDDTNDYIQLASDARGTVFDTQTFTIEAVIYPTVDPDTNEAVIWSNDYTSHSSLLYAQHLRLGGASGLSNELGFYWNNGSTFKGMTIDNVIPTLNVHYHIVATYQSGYQAVYVNGELLNSMTEVGTITYYNQEVWISRSNFGGYFGGDIPLLKFYNRALTASEVQANYNAIKGRFNI